MTQVTAAKRALAVPVPNLTALSAALTLTAAVLLAALAYFLGYDQGAVSVFGSDTPHPRVHP